jgi:hypothetical protein
LLLLLRVGHDDLVCWLLESNALEESAKIDSNTSSSENGCILLDDTKEQEQRPVIDFAVALLFFSIILYSNGQQLEHDNHLTKSKREPFLVRHASHPNPIQTRQPLN